MASIEAMTKAKIACEETGITVRKSLCAICDPLTQCGLDVHIKDGKIVKVDGSDAHPYNRGSLCSKGSATRQYVYHPDRIKTPLRRTGPRGSGQFEPISWDEALDLMEEKCLAAKGEYGPESVVFFAGYTKYFRPWLRRLATSFGSPNYCTESSTCFRATFMTQRLVFGAPGNPDIPNTRCLLVWSSNPFYTNPGNAKAILAAQERGMKLIVVDPRLTPTASRADIHLQLRPGTDGALALAMANVMIEENLYDADFVRDYTHGFAEYRDYAKEFTPRRGEELTGVPAEQIRAAARMFATVRPGCLMPSAPPVVHHTNGVQNYRAAFLLLALTGNYDVKGGNLSKPASFLYQSGNFVTREEEFETPRAYSEMPPRIGAKQFPVWMEVAGGEAQAMALPEQLRSGKPYPLKCLLGFGMNHRMWPDSQGFLKSLEQLDFIMNADLFLTDTCKYADLVLPACTSLERSELRCYNMGYVMLSQPAIEPLYESRSDVDIILALAKRLCPEDALLAQGYGATLDWILEPSGMTTAMLREHPGGMYVPNPVIPPPRKYEKGLPTPSGKVEFWSKTLEKHGLDPLPVYTAPKYSRERAPQLAEQYPFTLNTGSRLPMYVHTRTYRLSWTRSLRPHMAADLHPEDAKALGIRQDDDIRISTPNGAVEVKANLTGMVLRGVVHIYHGNSKADVNTLFDGEYLDPISGFPGYKSALCSVEKL